MQVFLRTAFSYLLNLFNDETFLGNFFLIVAFTLTLHYVEKFADIFKVFDVTECTNYEEIIILY